MISAMIMWQRLTRATRYALQEEDFGPILGAGLLLISSGTIAYSLGNGWNVIDSLYFVIATLTTSSIADPSLVLTDAWMKLLTVFYVLIGIGILVELLRRFGLAFIEIRRQEQTEASRSKADG